MIQEGVDKTIRSFTSFEEAKAEEYRYWQSRSAQERFDAAAELSFLQYSGQQPGCGVPQRVQRTLVRVSREQL